MPRRLTFDSIAQLPERYRQQVAQQLAAPTGRAPTPANNRPASLFRACPHPRCRPSTAGCIEPLRWSLEFPGRALTTNRFISALFIRDPAVRAARTAEVGRTYKQWKQGAYALALHERIPTIAAAVVTVEAHYRNRLPDAGALTMVGKAIIDGLVEAGVFIDDRPEIVRGEWYPAPRVDAAGDRVVVSIDAGHGGFVGYAAPLHGDTRIPHPPR